MRSTSQSHPNTFVEKVSLNIKEGPKTNRSNKEKSTHLARALNSLCRDWIKTKTKTARNLRVEIVREFDINNANVILYTS